jgi:hypothetical protein
LRASNKSTAQVTIDRARRPRTGGGLGDVAHFLILS